MRMRLIVAAVLALATAPAAPGEAADAEADGVLNPDEMSLDTAIAKAGRGEVGMVVCAQGYLVTKEGRHEAARTIFEACSAAGYTGTMTWMSQMDTNGFGGPTDPAAAAAWDRRAAEAGDPVGQFNYGLDLLRGHGVVPDPERGRAWIDRAAEAGLGEARRLRAAGYDVDAVTPDADAWRFHKGF